MLLLGGGGGGGGGQRFCIVTVSYKVDFRLEKFSSMHGFFVLQPN